MSSDSEFHTDHHPGWMRGVRIGSVKDGVVTAFIPDDHDVDPDKMGTCNGEGGYVDNNGVIYDAEVGRRRSCALPRQRRANGHRMRGTARWSLAVCAVLLSSFGVKAAPEARLAAFEAQLEANPSATTVLQGWCDAHAPSGTHIVARQVQPAPVPPPTGARQALAIKSGEAVRYRRVQLMCGGRVLSNADNWYLPGKLTDAMNDTLEHTETPFGRAVAALHFSRSNLSTTFLPPGGQDVLRHSAVLLTEKGEKFSFVVETYTRQILEN